MAVLNKIRIENFRGFDSLELNELGKINVLLGRNNCGKTSILEALFLLIGMSNPGLPENINRLRGILSSESNNISTLKYLFHDLNLAISPLITGNLKGQIRKLKLEPYYKPSSGEELKDKSFDPYTTSSSVQELNGLKLEFSISENGHTKKYESTYSVSGGSIEQRIPKDYNESLKAIFIPSGSKDSFSLLNNYSELVKKKKDHIVLETIQNFDKRVESIQALHDGIYLGLKGVDELVISNIAGDGIRRYLYIITTVANLSNGIILIDEIENGLHYSAFRLLWESILSVCEATNSQLFITTHNIETLQMLKCILEEESNAQYRDWINFYTIAETKEKGTKAYRYTYEGFNDAIDNEIEIRN